MYMTKSIKLIFTIISNNHKYVNANYFVLILFCLARCSLTIYAILHNNSQIYFSIYFYTAKFPGCCFPSNKTGLKFQVSSRKLLVGLWYFRGLILQAKKCIYHCHTLSHRQHYIFKLLRLSLD